jgi:hypothetical protein
VITVILTVEQDNGEPDDLRRYLHAEWEPGTVIADGEASFTVEALDVFIAPHVLHPSPDQTDAAWGEPW